MDRSVALIRSRCRERRLNKRLRSRVVLFKLTTDRHEASRGPFATAELLVDIPHRFLINMLLRVGFSRCLQVLVHWCGFHAARGESEWCILLWCLAAQTVAARHLSSCWRLLLPSASRVHKSTELLWHKTLNFTSDVWPVIQECVYQKEQGTSNIVDKLRLLTEWHIIFWEVG